MQQCDKTFSYTYQWESIALLFRENWEIFNKIWLAYLIHLYNFPVPVGSLDSEPAAQLSAKAQHHSTSVCQVDGHLARQGGDTDNTERHVCLFFYISSLLLLYTYEYKWKAFSLLLWLLCFVAIIWRSVFQVGIYCPYNHPFILCWMYHSLLSITVKWIGDLLDLSAVKVRSASYYYVS